MKKITALMSIVMLTGITPAFSANNPPSEYNTEIFCKKSKSKPKSSKSDRHKSDRGNGHGSQSSNSNNSTPPPRTHGGETAAAVPAGGPKGIKGDKGDKGDRGEPGRPHSRVYGYFYEQVTASIAPNSAVPFEAEGKQTGSISVDTTTGQFTLPETGDYQITFGLHLTGSSTAVFGILLNGETLLPGSSHRSTESGLGLEYVNGTYIGTFSKGDTIQIVNATDEAFVLSNDTAPQSHNAFIVIQKMN